MLFYCFFVESRYVLLPMVVEQLKNEMKKTEEMKSCIDILNDILITLTRNDVVSLLCGFSFDYMESFRVKREREREMILECKMYMYINYDGWPKIL